MPGRENPVQGGEQTRMVADTSASRIQALVFDIGQVIVSLTPQRAASALAQGTSMAPERLLAAIDSDPQLLDFQEGRLTPAEWHQHLSGKLGLRLDFKRFREAWNSALGPLNLNEEFFADLAGRYSLALLSNTDPLHVVHMHACFNFFQYFPIRLFSCEVGASKPALTVYNRVIGALGVKPQEILYIDDVAEYVEAGRRAGLQAYRFQGPAALEEELRGRAILK